VLVSASVETRSPSPLFVETLRSAVQVDALAAEWSELARSSDVGVPFLTAPWVQSWWRYVREEAAAVRDRLAVRVVRDSGGSLVGVAPMMVTERPATGPFRVRCLQFIGADPNWTELRGVLCAPAMEGAVTRALLEDLERDAEEWDWVQWSGVRAGGDAERLIAGIGTLDDEVPSYVLDLPSTWDALRAEMGRNLKESIRKCYNSLKRDGRSFSFDVVTAPSEIEPALADFFRLHAARAALTDTRWHRNHFAEERGRRFLVDVCQRLAERGQTRIFRLSIDGALAATRVAFSMNRTLYLYYSGVDPDFTRYSAATTVVAEAFKHAIATGHTAVNLGTGTDVSKTRWHPRRVGYRAWTQTSPSFRGRVAHKAAALATDALRTPRVWRYASRLMGRRVPA
jgi:CelD/BcsL family acetyltransferase involved in cellulose biosynthesis